MRGARGGRRRAEPPRAEGSGEGKSGPEAVTESVREPEMTEGADKGRGSRTGTLRGLEGALGGRGRARGSRGIWKLALGRRENHGVIAR